MTNNGCKRYCEVMNRPAYIVLFKGDDSDFEGNQSVDIVIDTELDTTGMKAHFRFMDFVQDFDSIPENKTLSLVFPNAKTSEFPLGAADATLRFEDASGKFRTISNRIHIVVTNSVHEAYDNEDSQSITVTVKGTVTWEMINGKPTFAPVATSGSYNDLTDKPTIPEPITVDPALSQTSENPVQNKVLTKALYTGFTEWVVTPSTYSLEWDSETGWIPVDSDYMPIGNAKGGADSTSLSWIAGLDATVDITATRHLITPTKTSQLTNDGAPNGGGTPYATTAQVAAKQDALSSSQMDAVNSGATAAKVAEWDGYAAQIAQKASFADLPYAMVTPGEWEFSPSSYDGREFSIVAQAGSEVGSVSYLLFLGEEQVGGVIDGEPNVLGLVFEAHTVADPDNPFTVTATRASLPGHLLDRAVNAVAVSSATTLTLPGANPGHVRDLLVRLTVSATSAVTWTVAQGESWDAMGAPPATFAAGTYLYRITEVAPGVWHAEDMLALVGLEAALEAINGGVAP